MSQVHVDRANLCDNQHSPKALATQTRNLNGTDTVTNTRHTHPASQQQQEEEEQEKEEQEQEEEDEVMKKDLICCQFPMTDSSYSKGGPSLLETLDPFSLETSPETCFISPVKLSHMRNSETCSQGCTDPTRPALTSDPRSSRPAGSTGITEPQLDSSCTRGSSAAENFIGPADPTGPTSSFTGSDPNPALLAFLDQLVQRGDDIQLPQHLHQIAEAFFHYKDYQQAIYCIHLETLYHHRVLNNLKILQDQWETHCRRTCSDLKTQHLDKLRHICQTHSRPTCRDTRHEFLDIFLRPGEVVAHPSCNTVMQQAVADQTGQDRKQGRAGFHRHLLTDSAGGAALGDTTKVRGEGSHSPTAAKMDQSNSAEQQGGDLGPDQEKKVKEEEEKVEEDKTAEEMEDEAEEEEDKKMETLLVETLVSEAKKKIHEEKNETYLQEAHTDQQEQGEEDDDGQKQEWEVEEEGKDEEGEDEEKYVVENIDNIRQGASLDDLAKLITVEEVTPASGLVSILKKPDMCLDRKMLISESENPAVKRRVRFKVPDDAYEPVCVCMCVCERADVGGGDSCLLLFFLCLVTVVISIGGTALYCALGDARSSVCQDFSRNANFYIGRIQGGFTQIQHWFTPGT